MKIGFIGLGTMGLPMALNIRKAGYPLIVHDKNSQAARQLTDEGAEFSDSYSDIARKSDIVITMLPESHHVEQVVLGENGIVAGAHSNMLFIDMSSVAPQTSVKINKILCEAGSDSLDAPVSGGPQGAKTGELSIMVGGSEPAFKKGLPILKVLGTKIIHMGEAGSGQTTKLCNQILIGIHIQAVAEAFALAAKAGLDLNKVRDALMGGVANSKVLEIHGKKILERSFDKPAFKLKLHRKDLATALEAGRNLCVPLYATALVAQQMDASMAQGNAEFDHTTIMLIEEQLAHIIN
ncbi:MAG: NAD-binding protein [Bacteroidales bacterium]|nr:NAD-binding protein [Bacteroidales bacterium]